MSAITDDTRWVVIVPTDPEMPVIGPLAVANGDSFEAFDRLARSLGFTKMGYSVRDLVSVTQAEEVLGIPPA